MEGSSGGQGKLHPREPGSQLSLVNERVEMAHLKPIREKDSAISLGTVN